MAAESVAAQQHHVERQHERADPDTELLSASTVIEPQRLPHVVREEEQKQHGDVQEIAVDVLHDQWKGSLPEVARSWLADRTVRRISPERLVVGPAIVVAGKPKQA